MGGFGRWNMEGSSSEDDEEEEEEEGFGEEGGSALSLAGISIARGSIDNIAVVGGWRYVRSEKISGWVLYVLEPGDAHAKAALSN